jgi:hypothetical protein
MHHRGNVDVIISTFLRMLGALGDGSGADVFALTVRIGSQHNLALPPRLQRLPLNFASSPGIAYLLRMKHLRAPMRCLNAARNIFQEADLV